MRRTFLGLALVLCAAGTSDAATLDGKLVNGTTGEVGRADRISIFDVTRGESEALATVENVEGDFLIEGLPDAAAAHFRLEIEADGRTYMQPVTTFDEKMDVFVYETTTATDDIALVRHHVIFTRDPEHMQVTEFLEFDNRTDPPRLIVSDALPMRLELDHEIHGAATASLMAGTLPIELDLQPTDATGVMGIARDLPPGSTRVVVRYLVHEEDDALAWSTRSIYPTEERKILVSPADVSVEGASMIASDSGIEGYAGFAALPSQPGEEWAVRLSGGSVAAATDHDHGEQTEAAVYEDIVARPNRLTSSRNLIFFGLGGLLLFATLAGLGMRPRTAAEEPASDERRLAVSKVADRYVSGEITREEYEREARRLTGGSRRQTSPAR